MTGPPSANSPTPPHSAAAPILVASPHPSRLSDDELLASCAVSKGRASGPGGQHRNKVETLIELVHEPTGVHAHAGERRSAVENKGVAVFRLRLALAVRCRAPVPLGEVRSDLWRARCIDAERGGDGRISCNPEHRDYPALLAEALDVIFAAGLDLKRAASRLCCTSSQLIKLLKEHAPAMVWLNHARADAGEHPLR
jgi:hypothetical protein